MKLIMREKICKWKYYKAEINENYKCNDEEKSYF